MPFPEIFRHKTGTLAWKRYRCHYGSSYIVVSGGKSAVGEMYGDHIGQELAPLYFFTQERAFAHACDLRYGGQELGNMLHKN